MCSCGKVHLPIRCSGLPSSVEFYHVTKGVRVPKEGWNAENFQTQNGVRLLQALVRVRRSAQARGMRALSKALQDFFQNQLRRVVGEVESRRQSIGAKGVITISPSQHADLWAQAIMEVFAGADMELRLQYLPTVQSVAVEVHRKTSLLIGAPWSDATNQVMQRRILKLAKEVTRINETTRKRLATVIEKGIDKGMTVREVIDTVKDSLPQIATNRIPTIVRTEMGRAADEGSKQAYKDSEVVTHVSVIGCEAVEENGPTYYGIPTCNIQDVPIEDVDELEFHINHTGVIVPSRFRHYDGGVDRVSPTRGEGEGSPDD